MESCTLCEHWSAHKARRLGLISKLVPALKVDGAFVPNPLVVTDRWIDDRGDIVYGDCKRDGDCAPLYTAWADLFANGHFSRARAEIPMMGVLDDHDYGQVARRRDDCVTIRPDRISRIPRTTNKTNYLRTTRTRPTHKINDNSD